MSSKTPVLYPNHPMYVDAIEAMKRYHEAKAAGCSIAEVEKLRQIAEANFSSVNEYQLKALGMTARKCH